MEGMKISFGFKKTKKAEKPLVEEKKDFIECVEEKAIKVIGGEIVEETAPLVIPMKPNTLITAERLQQIGEEVEKAIEETKEEDKPKSPEVKKEVVENETIEQMAVRELLQDAKKEIKIEDPGLMLPISSEPKLKGQKESTLEDYESVPVQQFGLAMLRGMGWAPGKEQNKYKEPQLRPKGLGLGADKVVKQKNKKATDKNGEELPIVKNAFVKITTGKYSGFYGKVVSLDDDNGRVMVDISAKKETVSLSEFMMQPVTKAEFDRESRVINADKYEEYKKSENQPQKSSSKSNEPPKPEKQGPSKKEEPNTAEQNRRSNNYDRDDDAANGKKDRHRKGRSSSSEDRRSKSRRKKEYKKKYSSNDSLSSSDTERRKKHKERSIRRSSTDSHSSEKDRKRHKKSKNHRSGTPEGKRDIDKKRKGKKKRRDRDRSPNYKKHRK